MKKPFFHTKIYHFLIITSLLIMVFLPDQSWYRYVKFIILLCYLVLGLIGVKGFLAKRGNANK
jgi:hypothetical protein